MSLSALFIITLLPHLFNMKDNLSCFATLLGIFSSAVALSPLTKNGVVLHQKRWTVGQTVETSSGSVQGHASSNLTEVSEYLGIPYAQPPLGKLRFQPPVKYSGTKLIVADAFVRIPTTVPKHDGHLSH